MNALEAIAIREARDQYRKARDQHERMAEIDSKYNRPLMALKEAQAARRILRYGPSETIVVKEVA
jgi:hypothetical protein